MRMTRLSTAIAAAVAAALLSGLCVASPAAADEWPTQAEVDQAKKSAAQSKAEYAKIQKLVQAKQSAAVDSATTALEKQNDYVASQQSYEQAAATAATLTAEAEHAANEARSADRRFGVIASQLYLAGGDSGLTTRLLLNGGSAPQLLKLLGSLDRLSGLAGSLQSAASQQANVATSLAAQAAQAQKTRKRLSDQAQLAFDAAQDAQQQADDALARSQRDSKVAFSEMAQLQNSSVQLQKKYVEHQNYLAALARQRAAQRAAERAAQRKATASSLAQAAQSTSANPATAQAYANSRMASYGWDSAQYSCLVQLWTIESGWRVNAYNTSSAAYGIPQAWPGQKMADYGADWMTNYVTQVNWGLDYIRSSYGNPCSALAFETSHTPYWY